MTGSTTKLALAAVLAAGVAALTLAPPARAGQEIAPAPGATAPQPGPPKGDPLGPDVFIAIRDGRVADLKAALAKGAQVEGRNWLEVTPLMWAAMVGNEEACVALLDAGAKINSSGPFGNALTLAEMSGNGKLVRLLMERGAKPDAERADGITPLMTAAQTGRVDVMRLLIQRIPGAVNAADAEGTTPLIYAARRGQTGAARLLLWYGAKTGAKDHQGRTALMYAGMHGHAETASLLLRAKADVHARDRQGNTALLLAARYSGDAKVVAALLLGGADRKTRDAKGRTAYDLAVARGNPAAPALRVAAGPSPRGAKRIPVAVPPAAPSLASLAREAVTRSLPRIEASSKTFGERATNCVSCHHQGVGLMATGVARERGFAVDRLVASAQIKQILDFDAASADAVKSLIPNPEMYKHAPAVDMAELTPMLTSVYSGLLAHGERGGETQALLTVLLASQQSADGSWRFKIHREPMQSSPFTMTALAVRLLKTLMPADRADETARRVAAARGWLATTEANSNEDRAFRLLGLKWAGADAATVAKAAAELRAAQRADGGWAQLPALVPTEGEAFTRSDAYATGQALYALNVGGGLPTTSDAYRKGVRYLLRTQDDDGSWLVAKRAVPLNTYFDGGFPHGQAQYASYAGTSWATMALALSADPVAAPSRRAPALAKRESPRTGR